MGSKSIYGRFMLNQSLLDTYGDIIRYHRKKSGLNRTELATLAQVGKTAIFDIEHSKNTVQLNTLFKVLDVLNIKVEFSSPLMMAYEAAKNEKS